MNKESAAILGASGLTGSCLLPLLLEQYDQVLSIARRPGKLHQANLSEAVVDFNGDWQVDFSGIDTLFITFGTTIQSAGSVHKFTEVDLNIPYKLARQAKQAGVESVILVSTVGANSESLVPYTRIKGKLEDKILCLNFKKTVILRPAILLGDLEGSLVGSMASKAISPVTSLMMTKYRPMTTRNLATAMVNSAQLPGGDYILEDSDLWEQVGAGEAEVNE